LVPDSPPYRISRRLLAGQDRLNAAGFARILASLDTGDPEGEVGVGYLAKKLQRDTNLAADGIEARRWLVTFYHRCVRSVVPQLERLARIARWETPILRWHRTPAHQRRHRGTNLVIKNISGSASGSATSATIDGGARSQYCRAVAVDRDNIEEVARLRYRRSRSTIVGGDTCRPGRTRSRPGRAPSARRCERVRHERGAVGEDGVVDGVPVQPSSSAISSTVRPCRPTCSVTPRPARSVIPSCGAAIAGCLPVHKPVRHETLGQPQRCLRQISRAPPEHRQVSTSWTAGRSLIATTPPQLGHAAEVRGSRHIPAAAH
jgi:hypothetical protein